MNYRRNEDKWDVGHRIEYNMVIKKTVTTPVELADEPVSLEEAKQHLRIDFADEDTYLQELIIESREEVEEELGIALAPQTIEAVLRAEKPGMDLPMGPVDTVTTVVDNEGNTLTADNYEIENGVLLTAFGSPVTVTYSTGFAAGECPGRYRRMIKERIALNYHNRGETKEKPKGWII